MDVKIITKNRRTHNTLKIKNLGDIVELCSNHVFDEDTDEWDQVVVKLPIKMYATAINKIIGGEENVSLKQDGQYLKISMHEQCILVDAGMGVGTVNNYLGFIPPDIFKQEFPKVIEDYKH